MPSYKSDIDEIKNKILISSEIEKKTRLTKKGKEYWCCCLFHKEKTPSMKINDELGSYYCFGCGAKGDIFNLYSELYNYSFQESVQELAQKVGVTLKTNNFQENKRNSITLDILETTTEWYIENLEKEDPSNCKNYLENRNLSENTIKKFKLGYSYNPKISLFEYLKTRSFTDVEIIKSNVVKVDSNNKPRDYFYKRLIFPIMDQNSRVVGFGGRSLDNSNPKYINSPESDHFHKRSILYNLSNAKIVSRKKNNLLICEGYMDVLSLFDKGIESVVAPLGTALTEDQLNLSWKFCSKPTIMFDGDNAGTRASYKAALMSLEHISSNKMLQFILLSKNEDPDSFINNFSFDEFIKVLKNPISLVDFVFHQASLSHSLDKADDKIIFDKFIDDIVKMIKDKKIQYFYKNEFKTLFFNKIRNDNFKSKFSVTKQNYNHSSLFEKQLYSFIASSINHKSIRLKIIDELNNSQLLDENLTFLLKEISKPALVNQSEKDLINNIKGEGLKLTLKKCLKSEIYQLFPYSSPSYSSDKAWVEIKESCNNLKTRLLNLQKINKSLSSLNNNINSLKWEEIQKLVKN